MNKIHMTLKALFAISLIAAISSCKTHSSQTKETASATSTDTTAASVATVPATPPAFQPSTAAIITNTVKDYAKWRPFFDADSNNRKSNGLEAVVVAEEIGHPNNIYVAFKVTDLQKAKGFGESASLKEKMHKAGVTSKPGIEFINVIRFNPDSHEKQWVDVVHKVKNYDAWLKVFDAEGSAKRAADGMVDVLLGRDVDDSNMVHLVFDIADLAKAKAAMFSPEKKKLMMSAGVVGTPKIEFYKEAE